VKKLVALLVLLAVGAAAAPAPPRLGKMALLLAAEDRRDAAALAPFLNDADAGVRRRAVLAAGRVGDRASASPVADRLGDSVPEVRRVAALALGLIGEAGVAARLESALTDADAVVRARAAEALGRLGASKTAPAVAEMVLAAAPKGVPPIAVRGDDPGNAADPWQELRLGLVALSALGDTGSASRVLLDGGRSRFDWWVAVWVAAAMDKAELDPVLLAGASSSDTRARVAAARALGRRPAATSKEALLRLVRDREEDVAAAAIRSLGTIGDASVAGVVETALRDASPIRKEAALEALAGLPLSTRVRDEVVALAGHDDPAVRAAALKVLARADRTTLALILSGLDRDPVWTVRGAVAAGLAGINDDAAVGILFGMLKDPDGRIAAAALDALRVTQGRAAAIVLTQQLSHSDLAVRVAAARGVMALGPPLPVRELIAAHRAARRDLDPEARLAIAEALAASGDDSARQALKEWTEPAPSPRPSLDYRLAMAPYDPAPDRPLYTPRAFIHTRRGVIEIHLNVVEAPLASRAFIALARRGFYNGLAFYRTGAGRAESGCPRGDGLGGPGFRLRREAGLKAFGRGAVGLDAGTKDAEGSRFFIALAAEPGTDAAATLLGTVVTGMEVADRLRADDEIEWVEIWDGR
jgi:HEAT repeat protein/cyclophilin family peptidyl-prolyl cis-trans isomerase